MKRSELKARNQALAAAAQTMTRTELAKAFGVGPSYVYTLLAKQGVRAVRPPHTKRPGKYDHLLPRVAALLDDSKTNNDISEAIGVSVGVARMLAIKLGRKAPRKIFWKKRANQGYNFPALNILAALRARIDGNLTGIFNRTAADLGYTREYVGQVYRAAADLGLIKEIQQ